MVRTLKQHLWVSKNGFTWCEGDGDKPYSGEGFRVVLALVLD
jgi:hypothetical protein